MAKHCFGINAQQQNLLCCFSTITTSVTTMGESDSDSLDSFHEYLELCKITSDYERIVCAYNPEVIHALARKSQEFKEKRLERAKKKAKEEKERKVEEREKRKREREAVAAYKEKEKLEAKQKKQKVYNSPKLSYNPATLQEGIKKHSELNKPNGTECDNDNKEKDVAEALINLNSSILTI